MEIIVRPAINKDVKTLPKEIKKEVERIVLQMAASGSIAEIANVKKIKGHTTAYRIRIKDYRLGFFVVDGTVILSRILHRKEVYRYFP